MTKMAEETTEDRLARLEKYLAQCLQNLEAIRRDQCGDPELGRLLRDMRNIEYTVDRAKENAEYAKTCWAASCDRSYKMQGAIDDIVKRLDEHTELHKYIRGFIDGAKATP